MAQVSGCCSGMTAPLPFDDWIRAAGDPSDSGLHFVGAFDRRITFYSQQVRALRLVHALSRPGNLKPNDNIAVVGAGAAGVTAALGLALLGNDVMLYDPAASILQLQSASPRLLHPHIYEWPGLGSLDDDAGLPILDWAANNGGAVCARLQADFHAAEARLQNLEFKSAHRLTSLDKVGARWRLGLMFNGAIHHRQFDHVVLSIGFGDEISCGAAVPVHYWKQNSTGSAAAEPHSPATYIVSGNGDGGLTDLLNLLVQDFDHVGFTRRFLNYFSDDALRVTSEAACAGVAVGADLEPAFAAKLLPLFGEWGVLDRLSQILRSDRHVTINSSGPLFAASKASQLNQVMVFAVLEAAKQAGRPVQRSSGQVTDVVASAAGFQVSGLNVGGVPMTETHEHVILRHGPDRAARYAAAGAHFQAYKAHVNALLAAQPHLNLPPVLDSETYDFFEALRIAKLEDHASQQASQANRAAARAMLVIGSDPAAHVPIERGSRRLRDISDQCERLTGNFVLHLAVTPEKIPQYADIVRLARASGGRITLVAGPDGLAEWQKLIPTIDPVQSVVSHYPAFTLDVTGLDEAIDACLLRLLDQRVRSTLISRQCETLGPLHASIADAIGPTWRNTTVVRAYARQIEAFERDAKSLGDLVEQESALWVEARVSGALDDAAAQAEARGIAAQLARAQIDGQGFDASPSDLAEPTIERLQTMIDRIERGCFSAEAQMEDARRLHGELQRALTDLTEVAASRTATQKRIDALGDQLGQAQKLQSDRRNDVKTYQQHVAGASTALSRLRALHEARALVARLDTEHRDAGVASAAADQAKRLAERDVSIAERRRQISQRIIGEIEQCDQEMDRLRDIVATVDQAIACEARIGEKSGALAELEGSNPNIGAALTRSEEMVAAATDRVNAQTAVVENLRDTVDTMSNAIASIATHLPSDACDCPLCATHFDSATELRARVSTAAERLAPALFAQEEALKGLSAALSARNSELQQLRVAHAAILSARADLNVEREQRVRLISRLDGGATETPINLAATRARLVAMIATVSARRKRKQRWHTHPALDVQTSSADYARAIRERDAAQRRLDAATRTTTDVAASLERARVDEGSASSATGMQGAIDPDDLSRMILEAEAEVLRHEEAFAAATRALTDADTVAGALEAELAGLRARMGEIDTRKRALDETQRRIGDDWLGLKQFGPAPDLAMIHAVEGRIGVSRLSAKEAAAKLARLREGLLAWSRQVSHKAVLDQIREQVDCPPNATRDEVLARAAALRVEKEAGAEAIREVKEIAKAASADISAELEDFNSEYIKPLGFLMSRINQAILCDPRVGIDLHVKKKKIEQSAVKGGEVPKAVGEIDPVLVHSEGQMAALAVSMLCAASLTFPWSRWKALILDDPLQHNDSIHAAAFADLMGNLVSGEGYQVLLSTHDVAQAEFLQRKFRSRRISCVTLSLLGLGKDGVEWSVQPSYAVAARSALA